MTRYKLKLEGSRGCWQLWLFIGNQSFPIGPDFTTKHTSEWYVRQVRKAFKKLANKEEAK